MPTTYTKTRFSFNAPATPKMGFEAGEAVGGSLQKIGSELADVAVKLQDERNTAVVLDSSNTLRGQARGKMAEALAKEGKDAAGALQDYRDWYDKQAGEIAKGLENDRQRILFEHDIRNSREHDYDQLSRHEAVQHKKYLESTLTGTIATAEQDTVSDPFNIERIESNLNKIHGAFQAAYPGVNTTELYKKASVGIYFSALQEMVKTDSFRANKQLEIWKDKLGGAYQKAQDLVAKQYLYDQSAIIYGNDFEKRMEYVEDSDGYSPEAKDSVVSQLKADRNEIEHRRDEAKKQRRVDGYNEFFTAIENMNYGEAMKVLKGWSGDDFTVRERVVAKELIERYTTKSDPASEVGIAMDIRKGKIKTNEDLYSDPRITRLKIEDIRQLESDLKKESADPISQANAISALEQRFDRIFKDSSYYALKPQFQQMVLDDIKNEEAVKGRKLTTQEVIDVGMNIIKNEASGHWYLPDKTTFQKRIDDLEKAQKGRAEPESQEKAEERFYKIQSSGESIPLPNSDLMKQLPDIPPESVTLILVDLHNAHRKITPDTIKKAYAEYGEYYRRKSK